MSELLIDLLQNLRANDQFRDELPRTRGDGNLEDTVQSLGEVGPAMWGGEEENGGDGADDALEHGVMLTL